ncbi:MAG: hypothetical protein QM754_11695 [Tepidisphaeraceae bacterium]
MVASHVSVKWDVTRGASEADYLLLWCGAAALCLVVVGIDVAFRLHRTPSALQRDLTWSAVEHFVPALAAGGLLTLVLFKFAHDVIWVLPGLWMILFGLGIHASRRLLPRFSGLIAGYYMMSGLFVLSLREWAAFNPWTMGAVFGLGQFMAAGLLRYTERNGAVIDFSSEEAADVG